MTIILTRGPEVRTNSTVAGYQYMPSTTTLADGSYVVTWTDSQKDGSSWGTFMQRYDALGNKLGGETLVNTTTSLGQSNSVVTALDDGGFVIAWCGNGAPDSQGIYYQIYDSQGFTVGGETLVNTTQAPLQSEPAISALLGGGFVISWTSYDQDAAGTYGVYARAFNSGGSNIGPEFAVNTTTADHQYTSSVATLSDGTFVITWTDVVADGSLYGIFMRHFSATGVALTAETLVNTTTSVYQYNPTVNALANGGYIVTWSGNGELLGNQDGAGIFYQIYDATDTKVGSETLANTYTIGGQYEPSVAVLSDGGFVIVWSDIARDGSVSGIFGQRFDENGTKIGPDFQVNGYIADYQETPVVSALSDGGFVVSWNSMNQDGSAYGVYSRRYGASTTLSGTQLLYGTAYNDLLDGGIGNDSMYGGQGDDTYVVNSNGDIVGEIADSGLDTIETSLNFYRLVGTQVENLTLTGNSNSYGEGNDFVNVITGNYGANALYGNAGNDTLFGGAGDDNMDGGTDNDILYGGSQNDTIRGDDGNDELFGEDGKDSLLGDLGNDTLNGGNDDDNFNGGGGNDVMYGGSGQDTFFGGDGNDTVYGGDNDDSILLSAGMDRIYGETGVDTLDGNSLSGAVTMNLATGRAVYNGAISILSGIENLNGSAFDDKLYGDAGNNVIDGWIGSDTMAGGAGNDVYYVDNIGDRVVETSGQGDDVVYASATINITTSAIETVYLTGADSINFYGNEFATEVWGNVGNNLLSSGLGADTMFGGLGNDTFIVDDAGDIVSENASEGTDVTKASVTYSLTSNVEILTLTGTANINGTGNSLNNTIQGNSGNNRLDAGAGGTDILSGFLGDDTYVFNLGFGVDTITSETGGADTILFGAGITSAMIITQDVGADRYYAIADGVHVASACANRVRIVGGASGTIETIAYTPPAAPPPAASSALLTQAIAALPVGGAAINTGLAQKMTAPITSLTATSLIQNQRLVA